jgi:hypothetical protein
MAVTENTYTGNGSTTNYSFIFPYLEETDIKVSLDGVLTTAYTLANATTVSFTSAPGNGVAIRIYRETNADTPQATFFTGSAIRAQDLNDNFNQVLYNTQETFDRRLDRTGGTMSGNIEFAAGKGIVFEGSTNDANEVTLLGGDPSADRTLNLPNASGTLVSTGDVGTVATSMIADSNVTTAKIADSNVTTAKIADSAVTSAKIADGTIATADIADGAVTSAKIADGTIVAADIASNAVTTAKILDANVTTAKIADGNVTTAKIADGNVTTAKILDANVTTAKIADSNVTTAKIADSNVTTAKIADSNVTTAKIADSAVTAAKIADGVISTTKLTDGTVVTNAEHSASTPNDTSFFTTSASDARYFRQDSTETIFSGDTWSSSDSRIASTAAIDARIIDLVDDVGGFVPIANETSFPLTNPDINNPDGAGTIISIKEISTSRTPSSGIVTIANGAGTNTVTINGCGSTVLAAGFGVLVETTSTLHTYTFHRLVPKATEVTTVASSIASVNTVAANVVDVNNFADLYQINANAPTVRADSTPLQPGDLWFDTLSDVIKAWDGSAWQAITPTQASLNDIAIVANDLATFDDLGLVSDPLVAGQTGGALETCGDNIADINTVADQIAPTNNVGTVAGIAANVSTVAGISSNVTTVAGNNANVSTVAGISGNVTTVAGVAPDVTTVAGQISPVNNIGTVAGISGSVSTVAGNNSNVTTVAGISGSVTTVAGISSNVSTVAGISSNVTTVATNNASVTSVAGSIANVNTVASSIADVNRYAQEYKISNTQPSSPSAGDLWYDGVNNVLKFYNGTIFASISAGITQLQDDTSPDLGGNLNAAGFNINSVGTIDGTNLTIDFGTLV